MGDLSKNGEKSFFDSDDFFHRYGRFALAQHVHPIKEKKSKKLKMITSVVSSLRLQLDPKTLPVSYHNWPIGTCVNTKIRVDNISSSAAACWSLAIGSLHIAVQEIYFVDQSNGYAFLTFDGHNHARLFLEKFNNKRIPESDMIYQLSWAPFFKNLSMVSIEKDVQTRQSDPLVSRAHKVVGYPMGAAMLSNMHEFHKGFRNEALKTSWTLPAFQRRGVMRCLDNGRTTIICLTMVDPCVEEGVLKFIFEQYGKCTVDVPNTEGCGLVKYDYRDCAEQAFCDLGSLLEDANVCCLGWGMDKKESIATGLKAWEVLRLCRLDWLPFRGENDSVKASKRPRSPGKSPSKRPRQARRIY